MTAKIMSLLKLAILAAVCSIATSVRELDIIMQEAACCLMCSP